jgi:diguanylate cyclase (GGDEF)-like protein
VGRSDDGRHGSASARWPARVAARLRSGRSQWALRALPARVQVSVLAVDLAAAVTVLVSVLHSPGDQVAALVSGFYPVVALVLSGVVCTEASLGVERMRRQTRDGPHIDLSSVWTFAGAVLLPGLPATVVALVVYAHTHLRVWRRRGVPTHQALFSMSTIVLAVQAASGLVGAVGRTGLFTTPAGLAAVIAGALVYAVVNISRVAGVLYLTVRAREQVTLRQIVGSVDDVVLEFATLSMGALVAGAMTTFGTEFVVLGLPPLIVLHRTVLVRQLEEAARTDGKTGLLNAGAWRAQAAREISRAERSDRPSTVFVLDLDHFKRVNDEHGHLVGDHVLATVARAVRAEVRDEDVVGRFGGEEFVVLLRAVDSGLDDSPEEARAAAGTVAERIRHRVERLRVTVPNTHGTVVVDGLTVSIGGATRPFDGDDLPRLLEVADAAMYEAKRAGRNCVRMGHPIADAGGMPRTG